MLYQGQAVQLARLVGAPKTLNLSVTSDRVELEAFKIYRIWSSVDAFFLLGGTAVVATTASNPITAKVGEIFFTDRNEWFLAGIVSVGTGVLYLTELSMNPY